jgi:hypothetical protein
MTRHADLDRRRWRDAIVRSRSTLSSPSGEGPG